MATMRRAPWFAAAVAAIVLLPAHGNAVGVDREDAVETFNRDVYFVDGSTLRNPNAETDPSAPLFNVFGAGLGLTWGDWRAATGASKVIQIGGPNRPSTDVRLSFQGLVPGGVYSVFYGTFGPDSENPLCPGVERTIGLPAFGMQHDGPDAYSFVADPLGAGTFHGRVQGRLLDATQAFFSVIFHSDGETYGELPNRGEWFTQGPDCRSSYGDDAHRQVVVLQKW